MQGHDAARRSERYLEILGVAADTIVGERDLHAWLARLYRMLPREGDEHVALYLPDSDGSFAATSVVDDDGARAAATLELLRARPQDIAPYLTLVLKTREALVAGEPIRGPLAAHSGGGMMIVPVTGREKAWAVFQFFSGVRGRRYDRIDLEFARDLCKLAAFALDNAALVDRARESLDDLRFLAGVSETLGENLDLQTRLDRLLDAVVPRLAQWASVNLLLEDGSIETVAIAHRDRSLAPVLERLRGPFYGYAAAAGGTPVSLRSGRTDIVEFLDDAFVRANVRPEAYEDIRLLGADTAFVVPLVAHGRTYGTLAAMTTARETPFVERTTRLIEEIARPAAAAIANARLYERNTNVAEAFQHASLPARLPSAPDIVFSAFYAAGRSEATVGGDWYDAFVLECGSIVFSIGDVSGSGLRAAVTMGCVRQLIRGAAQVQTDPAAILDAVDRALRAEDPDAIVTAFVGIVDRGRNAIAYASAGHPPPLLRTAGGIEELDVIGLPLGLRGGESHAGRVPCRSGSIAVLYTDGLTESTRDVIDGERRLRAALAAASPCEAANLARSLHDAVLTEGAHDDVALLTLSFT